MTAPAEQQEPPAEGQQDNAPEGAEDQEQQDQQEPTGKRAARQRAEAAEARAAAAEQRLAGLQRAEVARLAAAAGLAQGGDVLLADLGGTTLDAVLDEDGEVDADAVRAAVEAVLAARPGLGARRPSGGGFDGGARETPPRPSGWADLVRSRR